ncbi:MlaD family protein [Modicisalibacter xianhensis]|uniref:Phospholipid/cholesterol/gamma-HCH transport system substrate-binding protein n=1 Tax=Modicisalibacter xianhensis TaxID=442341 RepID=A0A1I3EKI4_9GAMM|nr:MlaD family protein [Halomonas xianhensis]SFH99489.1 phospholipid/cholesterol/gamma-HCH transport system substrate-binding protein [Halomonas xianhensis]|tara:strand:+ start:4253 stop:5191 length:939 start_codon:yes stop_codon:yes gene_type:complete
MEPRAHHVLIGLFTVITLGSALLFALWLGKSSVDRDYAWYEIRFNRAVSGLAEGNAVQYSGIEVGDVVRLRLDPQDPRQVRALIRVYSDVPVKQDTRASLALANITGTMNIQLLGGTPQSPRLQGGRDDPPLIQAEPSPLSSLLANSEELFAQVERLLTSANRLLSAENAESLTRTLGNLESVSRALVDQRHALGEAMARFGRAGEQFEAALESFSRLGETANGLLDKEGGEALQSARRAMQSLESTTARLDSLTARHEGSLARGLQGVGELDPAMRELHATLRVLNRLVRRFEENPAEALLGRDEIQEFSP